MLINTKLIDFFKEKRISLKDFKTVSYKKAAA
jgi:hypothetical protein